MRSLGAKQCELPGGGVERAVYRIHECPSLQVHHADRNLRNGIASPSSSGKPRGVVRGPQQSRLRRQQIVHLFAVPHMVAGRDDIHAAGKEIVHSVFPDAEPAREVLAVRDDERDATTVAVTGKEGAERLAAGAADDIAEHEDAKDRHRRSFTAPWRRRASRG